MEKPKDVPCLGGPLHGKTIRSDRPKHAVIAPDGREFIYETRTAVRMVDHPDGPDKPRTRKKYRAFVCDGYEPTQADLEAVTTGEPYSVAVEDDATVFARVWARVGYPKEDGE